MLSRLFIAALWSHAGKGLTSWLCVMFDCVTFSCGILGQVWYLIVSIPDLCRLSYFQDKLSPNVDQTYCRRLQGFIKLPFVITSFVLSIFEWPFYNGFTVRTHHSFHEFWNICVRLKLV